MSYISMSTGHIRTVLGITIEHRKEASATFAVWHAQKGLLYDEQVRRLASIAKAATSG
jgi:hypothetical protein